MAHAQKPDFVYWRNGRVHLNRRGVSVQSTTGSLCVRISGSNARYTTFRRWCKSTGYPLHSPVSSSLPLPYVTACHRISTGLYHNPRTFTVFRYNAAFRLYSRIEQCNYVSAEHAASIFRVELTRLFPTQSSQACIASIEIRGSSETSVTTYKTAWFQNQRELFSNLATAKLPYILHSIMYRVLQCPLYRVTARHYSTENLHPPETYS